MIPGNLRIIRKLRDTGSQYNPHVMLGPTIQKEIRKKLDVYTSVDPTVKTFMKILSRSWFQRIWVVQEVAASRDVWIRCGVHSISWHDFTVAIQFAKNIGLTRHHDEENLDRALQIEKTERISRIKF